MRTCAALGRHISAERVVQSEVAEAVVVAPPAEACDAFGPCATLPDTVTASRVQWLFNGALLAGGTNPVLVVSDAGPALSGRPE